MNSGWLCNPDSHQYFLKNNFLMMKKAMKMSPLITTLVKQKFAYHAVSP